MTRTALKRAFPYYRHMLKDPAVREVTVPEKQHLQVKRHIRSNSKNDRVYCFRVFG